MTTTTKIGRASVNPKKPIDAHAPAYKLFSDVKAELHRLGWVHERIDTLRHESSDPKDRQALTIRHHYDHDVWTFYLEPNKYWDAKVQPTRTATIRKDRNIPGGVAPLTVGAVIDTLFEGLLDDGSPRSTKTTRRARTPKAAGLAPVGGGLL